MKDVRHHLGHIQRTVIRAARRQAAEGALPEPLNQGNGHPVKKSKPAK